MYQEWKEVAFLSNLAQILSNLEDNEIIEAKLIKGVLVLLIGGYEPQREDIKKTLAHLNNS